jgi:hypothetical protein
MASVPGETARCPCGLAGAGVPVWLLMRGELPFEEVKEAVSVPPPAALALRERCSLIRSIWIMHHTYRVQ